MVKINSWFNKLEQARKNAIILFSVIVTLGAAGGWAVDMTIRVKKHFENKVLFEQAMTKKIDKLIIGQAMNNALSQLQMAKSGSLYFVTDAKGNTVEVSKELEAMTGLSFDKVKNKGWINYAHPSYQDSLKKRVDFTVESQSEWDFIFPFKVRGNYMIVQSEAKQIYTVDSFIGWVGCITPLIVEQPPVIRQKNY